MRGVIRSLAVICVLLVSYNALARADSSDQTHRLDSLLQEWASQSSVPGVVLRVEDANGLIIKAATQKTYHQVVREEVLNPLKLENTFEHVHELPVRIAPIHSYVSCYDMNQIHPSMEFADGGFVTTVADLTKLGLALNRGKPFVNPATLELAMQPYGSESIGLGPFVGGTGASHAFFYRPGHWGVLLYVDRSKQLAIAYTVNQGEVDYSALVDQVFEILYR